MTRLREWLLAAFRGRRADDELREEMSLHLEMDAAENRRRGMSERDAWRTAQAKFGGVERFMEETRDARGARTFLDVGRNFRIAWRGLARSPLFTLVVVLALAIGIGATTAVFGLINRMLLRPLPGVTAADDLVMIRMQEDALNYTGISYTTFNELRAATPALSGYAGYGGMTLQVAPVDGAPVVLAGEAVLGDYFATLGVRPTRGRFFTPVELGPTDDPFRIVLREDVAQRLYPHDDALGATLRVNGHTFTVVGLAPRGFHGVETMSETQAWVPPDAYAALRHMNGRLTDLQFNAFMQQFGRLAPGATPELVQAQLRQRMSQLIATYPDELAFYKEQPPTVSGRLGLGPYERESIRTMLLLLFGASMLVLVIACANVANLLIFRGVVRRGEAAVRRALGASLPRLLAQHLSEGMLLAGAGAAGGIAIAALLTRALAEGGMPLDVRVLLFTTVIALVVSILFGTVPTLMTRGVDLVGTLRQSSRSETGRIGMLRGGLVVLQLASSVALLVASMLMGRTLRALSDVDLGFDAEHTVAFSVQERAQGYDDADLQTLQQRLVEEAATLPAVEAVSLSSGAPFVSAVSIAELRNPAWPAESETVSTRIAWVSPRHFETFRIPLLRGRTFTHAEAADSAADVVILSRSAAIRLFGTINVTGRVVGGGFIRRADRTVVGVVDDVRHWDLRGEVEPGVFEPLAAKTLSGFELVVRTAGSRSAVEAGVHSILRGIDADMPFTRVTPLDDGVRNAISRERFIGRATLILGRPRGIPCRHRPIRDTGLLGRASQT